MKIRGPWTLQEIHRHLDAEVIPIRLAVSTENRVPLVLSLWFLRRDSGLWCASKRTAKVIDLLRTAPDCGFEVASERPPYRGVRGQGIARIEEQQGAAILAELLDRYRISATSRLARVLMSQKDEEVAICIEPKWLTSWDFSQRMAGCIVT
jgi:nitroimidazol reductase NimA-like FMN-containing flavoprotein (pyridoxamine 5'-phosphate oxidase superfamily)